MFPHFPKSHMHFHVQALRHVSSFTEFQHNCFHISCFPPNANSWKWLSHILHPCRFHSWWQWFFKLPLPPTHQQGTSFCHYITQNCKQWPLEAIIRLYKPGKPLHKLAPMSLQTRLGAGISTCISQRFNPLAMDLSICKQAGGVSLARKQWDQRSKPPTQSVHSM